MAEVKKPKRQIERKASAVKRARQSQKRHRHNKILYGQLRSQIKKLRVTLAAKDKKQAETLLKPTLATIAKMATKGILHRNTAARYQSRLQRQFNQL